MIFRFTRLSLSLFFVCCLFACAQGGSDENSDSGDDGGDTIVDGGDSVNGPGVAFGSRCGVVIDGALENPVADADLERVSVEVINAEQVIITRQAGLEAGNRQLVKLHGVSTDGVRDFLLSRGTEALQNLVGGEAFLAPAGAISNFDGTEVTPCDITFPGGGVGTAGQLFTLSGTNVNEALLEAGAVTPDSSDGCASNLVQSCYRSIEPEEVFSNQTIGSFLWKPIAERDGNLVVLVDAFNVTIVVQGALSQTLTDFGPSNGRGTTGRANVPGSAFGGNIVVTFFDSEGRQVLIGNGNESITVPFGSERVDVRF